MKHIHKAQKPSADLLMAHVKMSVFQWLADRDDKDLDIWQMQSVHDIKVMWLPDKPHPSRIITRVHSRKIMNDLGI